MTENRTSDAEMLEQVGARLLRYPQGAYDPRRVQQVIRACHGPRSAATLDDYYWAQALERSRTWEPEDDGRASVLRGGGTDPVSDLAELEGK